MKITKDMIEYELETLNLSIKKGKYLFKKTYQGYQLNYQLKNSSAEINIVSGFSKREIYYILYAYNWIKKINNDEGNI